MGFLFLAVQIRMGVSIGMALLGVDTDAIQEAMHFADQAMYRAKRAGRNTWRFHGESLASRC
ncbi:diguanylate cyclase domain-containing protein [Phytohalomonas tamaricis]|uniref:diguanylate cyclase domain-containing protein n=1 Tax=Phytohalomonas tamaricis TaxID=2081032 RepID=UPI001319E863|nr:diguanylate cyclase [Phytohalomonas tamaricis]